MRRNPHIKTALMLAVLILLPFSAQARQGSAYLHEQKIRAGIVYNFLKFTQWPSSNDQRLQMCLYGGDAFGGNLAPLSGKTAQQRTIAIRRINTIPSIARCDAVYIHESQQAFLDDILRQIRGQPVLTLSDIPGFARRGGMVELAREQQRIQLYINQGEAANAGIRIADNIQRLAALVSTQN